MSDTVYLLGSTHENRNDIYVGNHSTYEGRYSGVVVYAIVENPSQDLRSFIGGDTQVAYIPSQGDKWFVTEGVRAEIEGFLP
jgi:hypothetical protein